MAKDWIKMRVDLPSHPKVVRILSATKTDKFRVVGGLHSVWSVFDTHSVDGCLEGYTPETMDHIIGWDGFSDALMKVGWLEYDGDETLVMPDFDEHNSQSAKRRADETERKRKAREGAEKVRTSCGQSADKVRSRVEESRVEKEIPAKSPKGDDVPYQDVVDLYHEILPELPKCLKLTDPRKRLIRARWNDKASVPDESGEPVEVKCNNLDFWRRYFNFVRGSPFLMGQTEAGFRANLDFLLRPQKMVNTLEGFYDNGKR